MVSERSGFLQANLYEHNVREIGIGDKANFIGILRQQQNPSQNSFGKMRTNSAEISFDVDVVSFDKIASLEGFFNVD